ncbi:VCBS repeat-containing protein, partial [candidate division KSB1 bacterium]|nr:VCBS repeat-containing protein [candidate division KSB1 bacterium]
DLFVANLGDKNFLYANNGDGTFTKISDGALVNDESDSPCGSWGDYDNDGDLDLFVVNLGINNFLYANNGDGTFTKITEAIIVYDEECSNGCSWADYDNDGDLDLFVSNSGNNFLYKNNGNSNNWINIQCVGTTSNTSAIGARVKVKANINGNPVWQLQEISGQTGFGSQNSLNVEFGLGDATMIDSIRIEWPSGLAQDWLNIAANQFLTAIEGNDVIPVELSSFTATLAGRNVILKWTTESERNNYGFEIQRYKESDQSSVNMWEKIGYIPGNGTSSKPHNYTFTDDHLATSGIYHYRLKQLDTDGTFKYSQEIKVDCSVPTKYDLSQNYPNPFNSSTTMKYSIIKITRVTLKVYNLKGQEIETIIDEQQTAGEKEVKWTPEGLSSGMYLYRLQAGHFSKTRKLILLK